MELKVFGLIGQTTGVFSIWSAFLHDWFQLMIKKMENFSSKSPQIQITSLHETLWKHLWTLNSNYLRY